MASYQQSRSFTIESIVIYGRQSGGDQKSYDITKLCTNILYIEDITKPFLQCSLFVVDSAGLINLLPISGGEKVIIKLQDGTGAAEQKDSIEYDLRIWTVANRKSNGKKQTYVLGLCSAEALTNETVKVQTKLLGKAEGIIQKLLGPEGLGSTKTLAAEESKFSMVFNGGKRRPFDIGSILAKKCVPNTAVVSTTTSSGDTKPSVKGSAGYYFWETRKGYAFYSIDGLLDPEDEDRPAYLYVERIGNVDDSDDTFKILKCDFKSEVNILKNLRSGKYASTMVFFNPSTGKYSEYSYSLKDSYEGMKHLGTAGVAAVPVAERELSQFPTRYITEILDHESWFTGGDIASPEEGDGGDSPTPYADWQKYFMAQSIARYQSMHNQECVITVPGQAQICAGEKVDIRLRNKVANSEEAKEPDDKESSGLYLIKSVTHSYDLVSGIQGDFTTTLHLIRDSYGMLDKDTAHDSE